MWNFSNINDGHDRCKALMIMLINGGSRDRITFHLGIANEESKTSTGDETANIVANCFDWTILKWSHENAACPWSVHCNVQTYICIDDLTFGMWLMATVNRWRAGCYKYTAKSKVSSQHWGRSCYACKPAQGRHSQAAERRTFFPKTSGRASVTPPRDRCVNYRTSSGTL